MNENYFMTSAYLERFDMPPEFEISHRPPIVFLHGAYSGAWCWQPYFQPAFAARGWKTTAFSLAGHAGSEGRGWRAMLGIQDYVRNLLSIVKTLPEKPIIIAHSMGGFILKEYLNQKHPAAGAVFMAPVPPEGLIRSITPLMLSAPDLWTTLNFFQMSGLMKPSLEQFKRLLFSKETNGEELKVWAELFHPESTRALVDLTFALPAPEVSTHHFSFPIMVLGAKEDRIIGTPLVESCARYYQVKADFIAHCGHMMMLDHAHPQVLNKLFNWLDFHWSNKSHENKSFNEFDSKKKQIKKIMKNKK